MQFTQGLGTNKKKSFQIKALPQKKERKIREYQRTKNS
jgi:hypothetical protein